MIRIIYFVHGTTTDNTSKLCSGWKDVMINGLGQEQTENLGNVSRNRNNKFDIIFTSDLKKTIISANIAFSTIEKITDKRLRECNNGERLKDVEIRIREFIKYLVKNYNGKTVGIVAHRASQLALEVITKGISWEETIEKDWRKNSDWRPGWEYRIDIGGKYEILCTM